MATYSYNNAGELSGVTYSDGTPTLSYGFDRLGRQSAVTNGTAICSLAYNDASQPLSETWSGGTLGGLSVTNGYDPYLRRTNLSLVNGSSLLTRTVFGYDSASRLETVGDGTNSATESLYPIPAA